MTLRIEPVIAPPDVDRNTQLTALFRFTTQVHHLDRVMTEKLTGSMDEIARYILSKTTPPEDIIAVLEEFYIEFGMEDVLDAICDASCGEHSYSITYLNTESFM